MMVSSARIGSVSLVFLALAATLAGVPATVAIGVASVVAAGVIAAAMRRHLAWPVLLFVGLASLDAGGRLPRAVPIALIVLSTAVAIVVAGLHVVWAVGGRSGAPGVVPTDREGAPLFTPGPLACLGVAAGLAAFAVLLLWVGLGTAASWGRLALGVALVVLVARAIGEGRYVGFSKAHRTSAFARADDALYTPLVVLLAFGSLAALELAAG